LANIFSKKITDSYKNKTRMTPSTFCPIQCRSESAYCCLLFSRHCSVFYEYVCILYCNLYCTFRHMQNKLLTELAYLLTFWDNWAIMFEHCLTSCVHSKD